MRPKYARGRLSDPSPPDSVEIDTSALPPYARNAAEWWLIVDTIWPAIESVLERVGMDRTGELDNARLMREFREPSLHRILDRAWLIAPDDYFIHSWPQWSRFCDLCSEAGVLYE